jgi:hypothetical protein
MGMSLAPWPRLPAATTSDRRRVTDVALAAQPCRPSANGLFGHGRRFHARDTNATVARAEPTLPIAAPMPRDPPVTRAVRPVRFSPFGNGRSVEEVGVLMRLDDTTAGAV